ncbi:dynein axonemal intermediate chain 4-like [Aethina tumida]|uniref:dynein axonemal intermediate chain 4-like n=1 Tax=Aethina tumida TaxID=116153 RepID=UPI002147CD29|nr:dynein axonemal intermediate chain 4-like [Aethina tumida]
MAFEGTKNPQKSFKTSVSRGVRQKPPSLVGVKVKAKKPPVIILIDDDGIDRTPKELDPYVYEFTKERQIHAISATEFAEAGQLGSKSTALDKQKADAKGEGSTIKKSMSQFALNESFVSTPDDRIMTQQDDLETFLNEDGKKVQKDVKPPSEINLKLYETETITLLDIKSVQEVKDSQEGDLVMEDNEHYEFLTVGKGKHRRMIHTGVQTLPIVTKMRNNDCPRIKMINSGVYTSNWEMYDSLHATKDIINDKEEENEDVLTTGDAGNVDIYKMSQEERDMLKIIKSERFQQALCIMERLLANNCYNEQQKIFKDISESETYIEDTAKYQYNLVLLWTFANGSEKENPVIDFEWNPENKDILAVAHGKFYNTDHIPGIINIWNIKNPVAPERHYVLDFPVTGLSFSKKDSNILGVSLYNGRVLLIDISSRELLVKAESALIDYYTMDIPRQIQFISPKSVDSSIPDEFFVSYETGRVLLFSTTSTRYLKHQMIMRTPKVKGKTKGIQTLRTCSKVSAPLSRFAGAIVLKQHPYDPTIYYVGTTDGAIHTCSRNYLNQHIDVFQAHDGPVNNFSIHPFCNSIFLTTGSDFNSRIWLEGIPEPLFEASYSLSVPVDMSFSPSHPTCFAIIRQNCVYIWDFQRKALKPQSITMMPTKAICTKVSFRENGKCLIVGDRSGAVHVYNLQNVPYPPFFPENLLLISVKKHMFNKPHAIMKLKNVLGRGFIWERLHELKIAGKPKNNETKETNEDDNEYQCKFSLPKQ